jgi:hypothetical protein
MFSSPFRAFSSALSQRSASFSGSIVMTSPEIHPIKSGCLQQEAIILAFPLFVNP